MSIKALKTIKSDDYVLNTIQGHTKEFTKQLETNPLLGGTLLRGITLTSGNNTVNHKLGREIQGWFITDRNAAGDIYKVASQPTPARTIILNSSANITVDIYVF